MKARLCTLCEAFDIGNLLVPQPEGERTRVEHQPSLANLAASAKLGCQLCVLFHKSIDDWFDGEFCTVSRTEALNREEGYQDAFLKRFVISTISQPLDSRYAPMKSGYRALLYMRAEHAAAEDGPVYCEAEFDIIPSSGETKDLVTRKIADQPDFALGLQWVKECSQKHTACADIKDSELPTRFIDVGTDRPGEEPKLVLTMGQKGRYVTLSHCWGASTPPKTTTKTATSHELAIPFATLPRTFQDAVTTTRRLGFLYLWIDCFCILQDDNADWQHECARMHQTFANAALTIAGPGAGSTDSGFLERTRLAAGMSCELDVRDVHGRITSTVTITKSQQSNISSETKQLDLALAPRAWIMQERLLSSRILYFGTQQMYFECNSIDCQESLRYPTYLEIAGFIGDDTTVPKDALLWMNKDELLRTWYMIVVAYTSCKLTKNGDKLPALSGLASRFESQTSNNTYLAGLWLTGLTAGLTWYREPDAAIPKSHTPAELSAPSWSWASCDYKLMCANFSTMGRADMKPHITVNSASTNVIGLDPFGEVSGGLLSITGTTRNAILQRDPYSRSGVIWLYPQWSDNDARIIGRCYIDTPESAVPSEDVMAERPVTCLLLGVHPKTAAVGKASADSFVALMLQPACGAKRNAFRRIGLLDTFLANETEDDFMSRKESLRWMHAGSRRTVLII